MEIWERVIDRRLRAEAEIEEQLGFMPGRGTNDAILAVRQLMERWGKT
jgi:phytoene/squalene synthetase